MSFKHIKLLFVLMGIFYSTAIKAKNIVTYVCNEPVGSRISIEDKEFKSLEDGYTGIKPKFVFQKNSAKEVLIYWDGSKKLKELGIDNNNKLNKAEVIIHNSNQISFIETSGRAIWMHTIFFKKNIAFFSRHLQGFSDFNSVSLRAKCTKI